MFHPFLDLKELTLSQLYDKLTEIIDQKKVINVYNMNQDILEQLNMVQKSIEVEIREREKLASQQKRVSTEDEEESSTRTDRGVVFDMDSYVQKARNKYKK